MEEIDWSNLADTPVSIERTRIEAGEPCVTAQIAGLQYYWYWKANGLGGFVRPLIGDRLQLVRETENRRDRNAIKIYWHNQYMLGHIPREVSAVLAPGIDAGKSARAYILKPGNGERWSVEILLVGAACEEVKNWRLKQIKEEEEKKVEREVVWSSLRVWGGETSRWENHRFVTREDPTGHAPNDAQLKADKAFKKIFELRRRQREADLIYTFHENRRGAHAAEAEFLRRFPSQDDPDDLAVIL